MANTPEHRGPGGDLPEPIQSDLGASVMGPHNSVADATQVYEWRRRGAEFIIVDLELAFTFLDVAGTSGTPETVRRNQKNARAAYNAILRFLPVSFAAFSAIERNAMKTRLAELERRLEQLAESFQISN